MKNFINAKPIYLQVGILGRPLFFWGFCFKSKNNAEKTILIDRLCHTCALGPFDSCGRCQAGSERRMRCCRRGRESARHACTFLKPHELGGSGVGVSPLFTSFKACFSSSPDMSCMQASQSRQMAFEAYCRGKGGTKTHPYKHLFVCDSELADYCAAAILMYRALIYNRPT